MVIRVRRWGNGLGLRLPKALADELGLTTGTAVDLRVVRGQLVLTLVARQAHDLHGLVSRITAENRQGEVGFGSRKGREVW